MSRPIGTQVHLVIFGIFFLFAFWVAFALVYGRGGIIVRKKLLRDIDRLQAEVHRMDERSKHLDIQIETMRRNRRTIEAFAREIGYKRDGEIIFRFMKKPRVDR